MSISAQMQAALYYARRNRQGRAILDGLTPWSANLAVLTGDYVQHAGNAYIAGHSGTTGATPPTGYGNIDDGGVEWHYVDPRQLNDVVFEKPGSP
jgi:hypothetical protein